VNSFFLWYPGIICKFLAVRLKCRLDHQCIFWIVMNVLVTTAVTKMASCLHRNVVGKFMHWVYFVSRVLGKSLH
jgi:hypothetical protein